MSRAAIILGSVTRRQLAASYCMSAPAGTYVEFKESKRTDAQNRLMWSLLTIISRKKRWPDENGIKLSPDDFKIMFLDALGHEMRIVPNLSKTGYVSLGRRSSQLTKDEFSQLIELIRAFAAQHNIDLEESKEAVLA